MRIPPPPPHTHKHMQTLQEGLDTTLIAALLQYYACFILQYYTISYLNNDIRWIVYTVQLSDSSMSSLRIRTAASWKEGSYSFEDHEECINYWTYQLGDLPAIITFCTQSSELRAVG